MNSVLEITWIFALNFRKQNKTIEFTVIFMKGLGMAYTLNAICLFQDLKYEVAIFLHLSKESFIQ